MFRLLTLLIAGSLWTALPAYAQQSGQSRSGPPNFFALGIGAGPEYAGADTYRTIPYGAFLWNTDFARIQSRGLSIEADLLAPKQGRKAISYGFGPTAGFDFGRDAEDIDNAQVRTLGDIDNSVELGVFARVAKRGVLSQTDSLSLRISTATDIAGVYDGLTSRVSLSYAPQLPREWAASISLGASHGSNSYHDVYASVSAPSSAASGLPEYDAGAGFYSLSVSTNIRRSIGNDWFVGTQASIGSLTGDFANSPIVDQEIQLRGGIFAGRTFR